MKRSSKGKAYFYAYGQADKLYFGDPDQNTEMTTMAMRYRKGSAWPMWAQAAYQNGWNGY